MKHALVVSFLMLALLTVPEQALAQGASLQQALQVSLQHYGWKPDAIAFLESHLTLIETADGDDSPCPSAIACATPYHAIYVNQVPNDPAVFASVLNHEAIHEMEFARGSGEAGVGTVLADLLTLSEDPDHPLAAIAARRVLGLTGSEDYPVLGTHDWFHMEHDVLDAVGWDVSALPAWYADAYFPYLEPTSPARSAKAVHDVSQPPDLLRRVRLVVDVEASLCGPLGPDNHEPQPSVDCSARPTAWPDVIYPPMPGAVAGRPGIQAGHT